MESREVRGEVMRLKPEDLYQMTIPEIRATYRDDLRINRYKLEENAELQATIFERWYSLMEELTSDLEDAKHDLAVKRSSFELRLRRMPAALLKEKYGVKELKEGTIKAMVESNKEVIELTKRVNKIRGIHGCLKGAVESARQRKSMIGVLQELYKDNYWNKTTKHGTPIHSRQRKED
jgi:hypothetical protein